MVSNTLLSALVVLWALPAVQADTFFYLVRCGAAASMMSALDLCGMSAATSNALLHTIQESN